MIRIDEKRLLDTFLEYVQIDSETLNEGEMAARAMRDLEALGAEVWRDDAGDAIGSNGYNVYARFPGDPNLEPLLFSAHTDTVKPGNGIKPVVRDGFIESAGDTILASDDKSGVAGIVEALRTLRDEHIPHRTVEVMFSIAEEGGLRGAKLGDYSKLQSKRCVVLDSGLDVGHITVSAPGQTKLHATITGRSAHAGMMPEAGISAIMVAAEGIASMNLLRIDEETTANIGTIESLYATNIVPEKARIEGEARSRNAQKLTAQTEHMRDCLQEACDKYGATLDCTIETEYVAYQFPEDDPFIGRIAEACRQIGVEPAFVASGGGSDANVMNHANIQAVVLSTGMDRVHTTSERISLKNLADTARLCVALMKA